MNKLTDWISSEETKYFSGTATYTKTLKAQKSWLANDKELSLDLGDVGDLAEVIINGKSYGIAWKKPFQVNISGALQKGENTIEIKVTNLWVNRLIGDAQPGGAKVTYTTMSFYPPDAPLLPSGLIGPVKLLQK